MTRRQLIVNELRDRLKTVRVANGYKTDLGEDIRVWHPTNLPIEPDVFCAILRDESDSIQPASDGETLEHALQVEVTIVHSLNAPAPDVVSPMLKIRDAIADVVKALLGPPVDLGGLVYQVEVDEGGRISFNQSEQWIAAAEIRLTFYYRTPRITW